MCEVDGQESKMIYFLPQIFDNGVFAWPMPDNIKHIDDYNSPLMQYTGLKDKNGKEIYEGDIVQTHTKEFAKVVFQNGCFMWDNAPLCYDEEWEFAKTEKWAEIIGNIYENPELLK